MRYFFLFLLLAFSFEVSYAQTGSGKYSALDQKNGFRSIRFGMPVDSLLHAKLVEDDGDIKFYSKTDDTLKIGQYDVSAITYSFFNGKLASVKINIIGDANSKGVLNEMKQKYGQPYQSNKKVERYSWQGLVVTMGFEKNASTHNTDLRIYNNDLINDQIISEQKKNREGGKNF